MEKGRWTLAQPVSPWRWPQPPQPNPAVLQWPGPGGSGPPSPQCRRPRAGGWGAWVVPSPGPGGPELCVVSMAALWPPQPLTLRQDRDRGAAVKAVRAPGGLQEPGQAAGRLSPCLLCRLRRPPTARVQLGRE